jgi:hypothetical protein
VPATPTEGQRQFLSAHLDGQKKDWASFDRRLQHPSFVQAVIETSGDSKVRRYAKAMHGLRKGQVLARMPSFTGAKRYRVKELPTGRIGCTCNDWKYKRSVYGGDCKHVTAYKAKMTKTARVGTEDMLLGSSTAASLAGAGTNALMQGSARVKGPSGERVVLLHSDPVRGAGHKAQAQAIAAEMKRRGVDVDVVDFDRTFGSKKGLKRYNQAFTDWMHGRKGGLSRLAEHQRFYRTQLDHEALGKVLRSGDRVVLTNPALQHATAGHGVPTFVLHSDQHPWSAYATDAPLARHGRGNQHLATPGAAEILKKQHETIARRIRIIPDLPTQLTPETFRQKLQRKVNAALGRRPDLVSPGKVNVTVSGGAVGLDTTAMTKELLAAKMPEGTVIHAVAGKSKSKLKELKEIEAATAKSGVKVKAYGWAPLPKMMQQADLNVFRPHGTTITEGTAAGKPFVMYLSRMKKKGMDIDNARVAAKSTGQEIAFGGGLRDVAAKVMKERGKYERGVKDVSAQARRGAAAAADAILSNKRFVTYPGQNYKNVAIRAGFSALALGTTGAYGGMQAKKYLRKREEARAAGVARNAPEIIREIAMERMGHEAPPLQKEARKEGLWSLRKREELSGYRPVELGGKKYLLDKDIPVVKRMSNDPRKARAALIKKIRSVRDEGWTHAQVAISAEQVNVLKKLPDLERSRVSQVRLPGEPRFSGSWRDKKLHIHRFGPVWLAHEDHFAPQGSGFRQKLKHLPEATKSTFRRIIAPRPLIGKKRIKRHAPSALEKLASLAGFDAEMEKLANMDTLANLVTVPAEMAVAGATGMGAASIPVSIMAHKSEDPATLKKYLESVGRKYGVKVKVKVGSRTDHPLKVLSQNGSAELGRRVDKIETAATKAVGLHELGHVVNMRKGRDAGPMPNFLDKWLFESLGGKLKDGRAVKPGLLGRLGYSPDAYPVTQPFYRLGAEVKADAFMFKHLRKTEGTATAVRAVLAKSPGLLMHATAAAAPVAVVASPMLIVAHRHRAKKLREAGVVDQFKNAPASPRPPARDAAAIKKTASTVIGATINPLSLG